jgi:hypothetical protein
MIYMVHPQHGAMHVYDEAQAVANEKNGWVRAEEPRAKIEEPAPAPKPTRKPFFDSEV